MKGDLFVLSRKGRYVVGDHLENLCQDFEFNHFDAFLHDVVAVDVLDEVESIGLQQGYDLQLLCRAMASVFHGLLHHPASIAVFREHEDVFLDDREESSLVLLLPSFEHLLENIVPKLVLRQLDALLSQCLEDSVFVMRLSVLDDGLHCSGAVLISRPLSGLVETAQDLILRCLIILGDWDVDRTVAVVLLLCLQTQSRLGKAGTFGSRCWEQGCFPLIFCGGSSRSQVCPVRGRSP